MGANESSSIQVEFSRPNLFYFGGESITGTISFQNSQSKVTLDGIFLEFVGEIGFTSRETRNRRENNGHIKTEHYTQTHQIPFVTHRFPVVQPQYGQVSRWKKRFFFHFFFFRHFRTKLFFIEANILGHFNSLFLNIYLRHQFRRVSNIHTFDILCESF